MQLPSHEPYALFAFTPFILLIVFQLMKYSQAIRHVSCLNFMFQYHPCPHQKDVILQVITNLLTRTRIYHHNTIIYIFISSISTIMITNNF
jgi:hypothetical protein